MMAIVDAHKFQRIVALEYTEHEMPEPSGGFQGFRGGELPSGLLQERRQLVRRVASRRRSSR
jgi:hypothetical protein